MNYKKQEIIQKIKSRQDTAVLNWMYKSIFPKVNKYVLANNGTSDDSEDVFQEAVIIFYNLVIDGKCDAIGDVEGFIVVVARNKWINKAKKIKKEVAFEKAEYEVDQQNSPLVDLIMTEKWQAFQTLFDMLGERCKEMLTYAVYEKVSMEEIAVKMGFASSDAAKTANYRCKQKLIALVEKNKVLAGALMS